MGRTAQGYSLRQRKDRGGLWFVRFRHNGQRYEISTGEHNRAAAARAAKEIYARVVAGVSHTSTGPYRLTAEVGEAWLDDVTLRPSTRKTYGKYLARWVREIPTLSADWIAAHTRKRLRTVQGKTVRSELAALRKLCEWLVELGEMAEAPEIPSLTSADLGVKYAKRRRVAAPEVTPKQVRDFLDALPEVSNREGWWVRPRLVLAYETGLRPETIDQLSVPEHYARGSKTLWIDLDIDKEGFAREVPLSKLARAELRKVVRKDHSGLIFGWHKLDPYVQAAAAKTMPRRIAAIWTAQHLRSAFASHRLDAGAPLSGVQYMLGHRNVSTTARYVRPTLKAALEALGE